MEYHWIMDDDSGKFLVLNQFDEFASGPYRTADEANAWIKLQVENGEE